MGLSTLEDELKRNFGNFADERRGYEERIRCLTAEMKQQQESFSSTIRDYERKFNEYTAKTTAELQIQDLLNTRRSEALAQMEGERQRHTKARTKPTPRIGVEDDPALEARCVPYELAKDSVYRVDPMGMDTSWRDYQGAVETVVQSPPQEGRRKRPVPKFRIERSRVVHADI